MKVRSLIAMALAAIVCLGGCVQPAAPATDPSTQPTTQPTTEPVTQPAQKPTIPTETREDPQYPVLGPQGENMGAQQLRLPGYEESYLAKFHSQYGACARISTLADLNDLLENLSRNGSTAEIPEEYDEAFFQDHFLVCIPVRSGSGSARYEVTAQQEGDNLTLTVQPKITDPDAAGTADMADWLLLVTLDRAVYEDVTLEIVNTQAVIPGGSDIEISDR